MQLNIFNKGLQTRLSPHLIEAASGVIYENIDNAAGNFKPIKDKLADATITGVLDFGYYFESAEEWQFTATKNDFVTLNNILYKGDRVGVPQKRVSAGVWQNLGIVAPATGPTVTPGNGPIEITRATLVEDTASGDIPPSITLRYALVNKNTTLGFDNWDNINNATYFSITTGSAVGTRRIQITCSDTNFVDDVDVYRFFDKFWRKVGTIAASGATLNDDTYNISANAEATPDDIHVNGTVQYAITYYNSADGTESIPVITDEYEVINGQVVLTNIPVSADTQVDQKRIYRIGGNLTSFTRVTTIANATTSYTDSTRDSLVDGNILQSSDYGQAPAGLKFLTEAYAVLLGAIGARLYYTPIGKPNAWPATNFIEFPQDITGIAKTPTGLLIFTDNTSFIVTGTGPSSFAQQSFVPDQGCKSHDSVVNMRAAAMWVSNDGICLSDGNSLEVISKRHLGKIDLDVVNAVIYDEQYFIHLSNKTTLVWDYRYDPIPKYINNQVTSLVIANDKLYGLESSIAYELGVASTYLTATFKSGWLFPGTLVEEKVIDKFRGFADIGMTIKIYLNSVLARTYITTVTGAFEFKLPNDKLRYNYLEVEISGAGQLQELKWGDDSANA